MPILDRMVSEQKEEGIVWSPSKMIQRLGEEIKDENSIYYWAAKNKIPVFSPALTDGSIGDMLYFHSYKNPGLVLDIVQGGDKGEVLFIRILTKVSHIADIRRINSMAVKAANTGMIIVGGGLIKHHVCNANLMVSRHFYRLKRIGDL